MKNIAETKLGSVALFATISSALTLSGALAFQYIGGLYPCVLCMYQRWAYVIAAVFTLSAWALRKTPVLARLSLGAGSLSFLGGATIAAFHVGVENHWWDGTSECQGDTLDLSLSSSDLVDQLLNQPIVRCDVVPWDLFGISMAGYNVAVSLLLASICFWALRQKTSR